MHVKQFHKGFPMNYMALYSFIVVYKCDANIWKLPMNLEFLHRQTDQTSIFSIYLKGH